MLDLQYSIKRFVINSVGDFFFIYPMEASCLELQERKIYNIRYSLQRLNFKIENGTIHFKTIKLFSAMTVVPEYTCTL